MNGVIPVGKELSRGYQYRWLEVEKEVVHIVGFEDRGDRHFHNFLPTACMQLQELDVHSCHSDFQALVC